MTSLLWNSRPLEKPNSRTGTKQLQTSRSRLIRETSLDEPMSGQDALEQQFHRTLLRVEKMMKSNDARAVERDRQTSLRAEWQLVACMTTLILSGPLYSVRLNSLFPQDKLVLS